ncbi:hypothetical protein [Nonlabens sp. Asnod3-H03]|uniref:hypothetical protein n=1 Tax=Nonlabens sp. Asnod3-H03 TaxID=3160580 RepID=UPI00386E26B0
MTDDNKTYDENLSFNEDFCTHLEYHLGKTFELSERDDLKEFWCDGVSSIPIPDSQLTKKSANDSRKIITKAWIGKTGQDEYEMTIQFGKYSLLRYAKGTDMKDCILSENEHDWYYIDTRSKKIQIQLR